MKQDTDKIFTELRKRKYATGTTPVGYEKFYLDTETADVKFSIGSGDSGALAAHKIVLAAHSDPFKALFYGKLKEKGNSIRLIDVSEAAFRKFLQFFYFNEVDMLGLSIETVTDLLHLGHKYMTENCIDACDQFLRDCHTADNILFIMSLAMLYGHSDLIKFCERFIVLNTEAILNSNGFLECDRQTLAHIFQGSLFICSEIELFKACMAWVKAKSGQNILSKGIVDEHLGELFYEIRFRSMTIEEFCELAKEYDAVMSADFITITELIGLPEFQPDRFNTHRRQLKWNDNKETFLKCDREESSYVEDVFAVHYGDTTNFTISQPLLLTGFTCNSLKPQIQQLYKENFCISVQVQICESNRPLGYKNLLRMNVKLPFDKTVDVSLPRPILVKPGFLYGIHINFPGEYGCYTKSLCEEENLDSDTYIQFYDYRTSDHVDEYGDVEAAIIGMISAMEFQKI